MTFFDWLVPKDERFFDSIASMIGCVSEGVGVLSSSISGLQDLGNEHEKMREIEHRTEEKLHEVKELLEEAFITPIDPVEINEMINDIRTMIHLLVDTSTHIYVFGREYEYLSDMENAVALLKSSVEDMESAFGILRTNGRPKDILPCYISAKKIETEIYILNARATHTIYSSKEPINIIKYGKIFGRVCDLASLCEDRTGAIYDIAVRHV